MNEWLNVMEDLKAFIRQGKNAGDLEVEFTYKDISRTMVIDYHKFIAEFLEKESARFAIESGMLEEIYRKYGKEE